MRSGFYDRNRVAAIMTRRARQYARAYQGMIEHVAHKERRRVVTIYAIKIDRICIRVTKWLSKRGSSGTGMATRARAIIGKIGVINAGGLKRNRGMTSVTLAAGHDMIRAFANRQCAIMTAATIADHAGMIILTIEIDVKEAGGGGMAIITFARGRHMAYRFANCNCPVMAVATNTKHLSMINRHDDGERILGMASLAHIAGCHMVARFAFYDSR